MHVRTREYPHVYKYVCIHTRVHAHAHNLWLLMRDSLIIFSALLAAGSGAALHNSQGAPGVHMLAVCICVHGQRGDDIPGRVL